MKAWELSGGHFPRAQKALGYWFLQRGKVGHMCGPSRVNWFLNSRLKVKVILTKCCIQSSGLLRGPAESVFALLQDRPVQLNTISTSL